VAVRVRCHAKLNLFLKVYGKRPDGFHDIVSIMQSIDLADTLVLEESAVEGIEIVCTRPGVPLDSTNLAWKAAELMSAETGHPVNGLRITIEKDIPMMGGLAGGSADGAGALVGLRRLWGVEIEDQALFKMAAGLGSDVPFCLLGGTAVVRGRGEILDPLPTGIADRGPDACFLLLIPPVQVETKGAYDLLDRSREREARKWSSLREEHTRIRVMWQEAMIDGQFPVYFFNDFEQPILTARPELAALHSHLRNVAGHALMSGSGSCVFAYFDRSVDALSAASAYVPLAGEIPVIAFPASRGIDLD